MIRVFVYGTLMPGYRNHERFAAPHLISCRPATTQGKLYHLPAGYPGVVEGEGIVHGKLLELRDEALPPLDELEAYDPAAAPEENEYYRREVSVALETGDGVNAWIYFIALERVESMRGIRVESGHWRGE
ncbi:MAG TPA: gamma-glutamylcyclotransferase family protein [Chthoniobacterales bacterium]